jgi:3-phosphoshikimate 1-carboxyvinyltransferase
MLIKRKGPVVGAPVDAHGDHRIAMACGVAALQAEGSTHVQGAEAVDKSYPGFWDHMELLGAEVSLINTIK